MLKCVTKIAQANQHACNAGINLVDHFPCKDTEDYLYIYDYSQRNYLSEISRQKKRNTILYNKIKLSKHALGKFSIQ